ncbi:MAG: hypothetical protein JSU72_20455 [Deltaproteobacteria bacterium]|nr:MAG: hypothetical protein JSU72_20455 [Deltaproteobacteria bacterium]
MREENQPFESEPWQAEYVNTWSRLPLGLRRHLARIAPREAFQLVLSDGSDEILEAFVENPHISQAEILILIDRARTLHLLEKISRTPKWYASHTIKRRLLSNPHVPYSVACRILDYLPFVELRRVMTNVNLSSEIRSKARESFRKAFQRLSDGDTSSIFLSTEGRVLRELTVLTAKDKRVLIQLVQRPQVPRALVQNLASSSLTPPEVLQLIARRPIWIRDSIIRRALLANSKTPRKLKDSLRNQHSW